MTNFFQLFIYSNGEVGLKKEYESPEVQVASNQLTTLEPLMEHIKSLKPEGVVWQENFLRIKITISGKMTILIKNDRPVERLYDGFCDTTMVNDLVNEILSVLPQE